MAIKNFLKTKINKIIFIISFLLIYSVSSQVNATIHSITIQGAIGPAYESYFNHSLNQAINENATALLLNLDTPGGLDSSMRSIIKSILASPIPVITYVTPSGARAASAGTYILYASHIAAMAPGTNLGAATPVSLAAPNSNPNTNDNSENNMLSSMEKKVINDAIAYIEGLAEIRERNSEWAKKAVQDGESLSASAALKENVIDFIAENEQTLLNQVSTKIITINKKNIIIPQNTPIITIPVDFKTKILSIITSPDIAYMLLIAGVYCLFFEFSNPGLIVPGILGAISLVLSIYGLNILPISWIGFTLILIGIACLIAEIFISSYGLLGIAGSGFFLLGSFMLIEPNSLGLNISTSLIIITTIINLGFFLFIVSIAIKSQQKAVTTGLESLIGESGRSLQSFSTEGQIKVNGEIWNALAQEEIKRGETCTVINISNRTLIIRPKKNKKENKNV